MQNTSEDAIPYRPTTNPEEFCMHARRRGAAATSVMGRNKHRHGWACLTFGPPLEPLLRRDLGVSAPAFSRLGEFVPCVASSCTLISAILFNMPVPSCSPVHAGSARLTAGKECELSVDAPTAWACKSSRHASLYSPTTSSIATSSCNAHTASSAKGSEQEHRIMSTTNHTIASRALGPVGVHQSGYAQRAIVRLRATYGLS